MLNQDHLGWFQDPCRKGQPFSTLRFAVLTLLFLVMLSGMILLALLEDQPWGIQISSMMLYTAAIALYTFSSNRNDNPPFFLSCPVVRRELPRLIRRHLGFLAALFTVQTIALDLRPNLPAYWTAARGTDASLFAVILGGLCTCMAIVQTLSNRSLLERAHEHNRERELLLG